MAQDNVAVFGKPGTLYARMGGAFGVCHFVDSCMDKWMHDATLNANPLVATWHQRLQRCGFKFLVSQFMCAYTDGPQTYTGRSMRDAHKHLNISGDEWTKFMELFGEVCKETNFDQVTIEEVVTWVESFRSDCVVEPGEEVPANPGHPGPAGDSLYARLGGVYPICLFTDRLVDALIADERVRIPVDEQRNEASLKYFFTELFCSASGGPEEVTSRHVDLTKLLISRRSWPILVATARIAADQFPANTVPEVLRVLEDLKPFAVDPQSPELESEFDTQFSDSAVVKDVKAAGAGRMLSRAALAARRAAPGAHVAARRRVFGDPRTLYGRGGGVFGLARLSSRLVDTWMSNPLLNRNCMVARWHTSHQKAGFKFLVTQIMGYLTGGPQRYTGRPMELSHKHLAITDDEWASFMKDSEHVFEKFCEDLNARRGLFTILASFKNQIIVSPGEKVPADPGISKPANTTGTLFDQLGGIYPIARFVDRLVELVLTSTRVHVDFEPTDDLKAVRHPPGLKYVVTELISSSAGGAEVVTSKHFEDAKLGVPEGQWRAFLHLAEESASEVWKSDDLRTAMMTLLEMEKVKSELCADALEALQMTHEKAAPKAAVGTAKPTPVVSLTASAVTTAAGGPSGASSGVSFTTTANNTEAIPAEGASRCPFLQATASASSQSDARSFSFGVKRMRRAESPPPDEDTDGVENGSGSVQLPAKVAVGRVLGSALQDQLDDLIMEEDDLVCPISLTLFMQPVTASDGFVYEKSSLEALSRGGGISPVSQEPLGTKLEPAAEKREAALEFRRGRSTELVNFAREALTPEPYMSVTALDRLGEYVRVLKPETVPDIAQEAAELWQALGEPVPPELTAGGMQLRKVVLKPRTADAHRSGGESMRATASTPTRSSATPVSTSKHATSPGESLHQIEVILSAPDGAATVARKLYERFQGDCALMPGVLSFVQEKWGFSDRFFPFLQTHLRRVIFQRRGTTMHIDHRLMLPGMPNGTAGEAGHISEAEWVDAFDRWLQTIQTRCATSKMSRSLLVQKRDGSQNTDITSVYFKGGKLGAGAFGEVHMMFHKTLAVERVVKVIRKEQLSIAAQHAGAEVEVLKSLDHPHVVRVFETFETEDALQIVMDFAGGGDLEAVIRGRGEAGSPAPEEWTRVVVQQIVAALEYTHSKGVIHCDLKPANVMLLRHPQKDLLDTPHALLVDFGLAELFDERKEVAGVVPGKVKGTPVYLAPEGFEANFTEKTDIWALGVTAYEMLLGRRPFQGAGSNVFALWAKVARSDPKMDGLKPVPAEFVKKLLTKDPKERPSAKECRALEWLAAETLPPTSVPPKDSTLECLETVSYFKRAAMFCIAAELSIHDMQELYDVFTSLDKDKVGRLSEEHLAEGLRRCGIKGDAKQLMAILDMDQNGYISYTEFVAGVLSTERNLSDKLIREAFETFDLDGDGSISFAELRAMLSGDGPLVDVLPDGTTVDEIMAKVGQGEGLITYENFREYITSEEHAVTPGTNLKRFSFGDISDPECFSRVPSPLDGPTCDRGSSAASPHFEQRERRNFVSSLQAETPSGAPSLREQPEATKAKSGMSSLLEEEYGSEDASDAASPREQPEATRAASGMSSLLNEVYGSEAASDAASPMEQPDGEWPQVFSREASPRSASPREETPVDEGVPAIYASDEGLDLPMTMHRWLSKALSEGPGEAEALRQVLSFCGPDSPYDGEAADAALLRKHLPSLKKHFQAGARLAELLANEVVTRGTSQEELRQLVHKGLSTRVSL